MLLIVLRRVLALIVTVKEREIAFIIQNALNFVFECDGTLDYCIHLMEIQVSGL